MVPKIQADFSLKECWWCLKVWEEERPPVRGEKWPCSKLVRPNSPFPPPLQVHRPAPSPPPLSFSPQIASHRRDHHHHHLHHFFWGRLHNSPWSHMVTHPVLKREDRLGKHPFAGFGTVVKDITGSGYTKNQPILLGAFWENAFFVFLHYKIKQKTPPIKLADF